MLDVSSPLDTTAELAEAARSEQREQAAADRAETLPAGVGTHEGVVRRELVLPDDALGEVAALERLHLRGEEAGAPVHGAIAVVVPQHVLIELELDR